MQEHSTGDANGGGSDAPAAGINQHGPFDAQRYLTKISGKDYLEVKWRLVWLRSLHPDAILVTEMVKEDGTTAIFKATVTIPGGGSATGWGSESYQDFADYVEKAETKSIGRALGALGFGTQFTHDYESGDGGRIVDAPVDISRLRTQPTATSSAGPRPPQRGTPDPATERQLKAVYAIGRAGHLSDDELVRRCGEVYGCRPEGLSRRDASNFIDLLKQEMGG